MLNTFKHPALPARWVFAVLATAMLNACSGMGLSPVYERPPLTLPSQIDTQQTNNPYGNKANAGAPKTNETVILLSWWKVFNDPVLNNLLQEAVANSPSMALAAARVVQSRATLRLNQSSLYPTVNLVAGTTRLSNSENAPNIPIGASNVSTDLQLGLSASYEIDFWGKYAQADAAAQARLWSQKANLATVQTTLYANVAQSYFALRALDAQLDLSNKTLATRREYARLQQLRFDAGVIGHLELQQALAEAGSTQVLHQQTLQSQRNALTLLATLLGRQPDEIFQSNLLNRGLAITELAAQHAVPAKLPSDILLTRPDVIQAEQALIAANADIGVARSAYFPKLSLTAAIGQQSKTLSDLLDPVSLFWSLAANLTQPLFKGGAIDANVAAATTLKQQAQAQYILAVQNAFKDTGTALNNLQANSAVAHTTLQRITQLEKILQLVTLRYDNGYSSYLEVLNAQRDVLQSKIAWIEAQRNQLNATVNFYQAVGGGWDTSVSIDFSH